MLLFAVELFYGREIDQQRSGNQRIKFVNYFAEKQQRQLPVKSDLFPEKAVELSLQLCHCQRISPGEILRTPFVMHDFAGNIDQRQAVQPAGHGAMLVDKAASITVQQHARCFVIFRHQLLPLVFRAMIEQVRVGEFRPLPAQLCYPALRFSQNRLADFWRKFLESLLQVEGVKQSDVEQCPAAAAAPLAAADLLRI